MLLEHGSEYIYKKSDSEIAEAFDIDTRNGALITDVVEDSPAEDAGIQEGDVIVAFNGKTIADPANLKNVVSLTAPDSKNKVKLVRDGKTKIMDVVSKSYQIVLRNFHQEKQVLKNHLD